MYRPGRREQVIILILAGALLFGAGVKYAQLKGGVTGAVKDVPVVEQSNVGSEDEQFEAGSLKESMTIKVHVFGEVKNSGVYEVEEGARVVDAVKLAGPTGDADLDAMSLAAPVTDGQDIYVPSKREKQDAALGGFFRNGTGSGSNTETGRTIPFTASSQRVNINTATQEELETLPGIGPVLAGRIIEYRQKNGRFLSAEDIKNVSGIGDAKFEQIKDKITLY